MLILGILGIVQQVFLPGYLYLVLTKEKNLSPIQLAVFSLALSLFFNYQILLVLNFLNLYSISSLLILISLELILLFSKRKSFPVPEYLFSDIPLRLKSFTSLKLYVPVICVLVMYLSLFIINIGSVFYYTDSSIGNFYYDEHTGFWYKYALYWSRDLFPPRTFYFPQLLSANWSISHVLTGDQSITLFNKILMGIFPAATISLFLDLSIHYKRQIYLAGLIILAVLIPMLFSFLFLVDGNPEVVLMFFSFLAIYFFYTRKDKLNEPKNVVMITIFAASTALIKLSGASMVFLLGCWFLYSIFNRKYSTFVKIKSAAIFAIVSILSLSWYILKPMQSGLDQSGYFTGQSAFERFITGFNLLATNFSYPVFILIILLFLFSIVNKESRYFSLFLLLPVWGLYMARYGYSIRNASITLPMLAFILPFGIKQITGTNFFRFKNFKINKLVIVSTVIILLLFCITPLSVSIIDSSYFLIRSRIFNFTRENLDVFLGYEKHFQVFINALRTTCILIICYSLLPYLKKIGSVKITIFILLLIITLNFTFLNNKNIKIIQKDEIKEIAELNLQHLIKHSRKQSEVTVLSNTKIVKFPGIVLKVSAETHPDSMYSSDYIFLENFQKEPYVFKNYEVIYDDLSYTILQKN